MGYFHSMAGPTISKAGCIISREQRYNLLLTNHKLADASVSKLKCLRACLHSLEYVRIESIGIGIIHAMSG